MIAFVRPIWLVLLALALMPRPASAQADPSLPPGTSAVFDAIDDLDKLRLLNPIGINGAQARKIVELLETRQKAYNQRLIELAVEPLKAIGEEIKATRDRLLTGGSIPTELDERIKKSQKDFVAKRKVEQDKNLKLVADGFRAILTPEQNKKIIDSARQDFEMGRGTDEQFYNLWVRETIIAYPRILPLFRDIAKARMPGSGSEPQS
ncbi:MAG: hypothetical protein HUU17_10005 [Chthonomonadales bacterium]|nr:hypothetical protein [Chthonomonadales bacterium]